MALYNRFNKGSIWRKWDLQVSTNQYTNYKGISLPSDKLDKLKTLSGLSSQQINSDHKLLSEKEYAKLFVEYLANFTDISAVAVMNHNTGKGLQEILDYLELKKDFTNSANIYNDIVIFPGVEIGGCDRCHILIVFNPETDCKNKFIFNQSGKKISSKNWDNFIEEFLNDIHIPAQRFNNGAPANSRDFGVTEILSKAKEWDFIPILPHISNSDGWWKELQESNRKESYLSENFGIVDNKAGSSNTNLERILDGLHSDWGNKIIAKIKTSDSTCLNEIGQFYSWIKADTTFEGLRQIIYEPEIRINNGLSLPQDKAGYQVIERIEINNPNNYNTKLELNPNLNTIIGGRSTGKSILLGAIAKRLKTTRPVTNYDVDYDSFIKSISDTIKVFWKDGIEDNNREIEYFQQGYMNDIAKDATKFSKIVQDILIQKGKESIINVHNRFLSENSKKISGLVSDLFQIKRDIKEKRQKASDKGDVKGVEDEIKKLQIAHDALNSVTVTAFEKEIYESNKEQTNTISQNISILIADIQKIDLLISEPIFKESISYETTSLSQKIKNRVEDIFHALTIDSNQKWKESLQNLRFKLVVDIETNESKLTSIRANEIYRKVSMAFGDNIQYKELEEKIKHENGKLFEIKRLLLEIGNLENQQAELYKEIKLTHSLFYKSFMDVIPELSDSKDGLDIKAKPDFDEEMYRELLASGLNLQGYDNQTLSNFKYVDYDNYEKHIFSLIDKLFLGNVTLKTGYTSQSLFSLLMSTNHYELAYDIEFEKDDFRKMSDGKKAFVVLKLLLDFSDKDCPILIDQPEDDLDNRAIYSDLVQYIRKKKILRQIIVATHNANIVVGADSELVICANQHGDKNQNIGGKKFQYVSGSLEHTFKKIELKDDVLEAQGMREHVCEVLEGGNIAFKLREKKYAIKN